MKTLLSIFSVLLIFLAISTTPVQAYFLDAPHNEANGVLCSYCHSHPVWSGTFVPQNIDDTAWNTVCNDCHGIGGTDIHGALHSDLTINGTENWTTQCIDCHNPHFQDQFRAYGNTFPQIYLVDAQLVSGSPIVDNGDGTTNIEYTTISLPLPPWDNPATWEVKGNFSGGNAASDGSRGLILASVDPINAQLYEVISATGAINSVSGQLEGTITLKGQTTYQGDTGLLANAHFGLIYGQLIKSELTDINTHGQGARTVKFFSPVPNPTGLGGFVDNSPGPKAPEGICQVCHIPLHGIDEDCSNCHSHENGFGGGDFLSGHSSPFLSDNNNCTSCHAAYSNPEAAHINTCLTCHNSYPIDTANIPLINNNIIVHTSIGVYDALNNSMDGHAFNTTSQRLYDNAGLSVADPGFAPVDCIICHIDKISPDDWTNHAVNTHPTQVIKTSDGTCEACHGAVNSPFIGGGEVHFYKGCFACHASVDGSLQGIAATNHTIGTPSNCAQCHSDRVNGHIAEHGVIPYEGDAPPETNSALGGQCAVCHPDMGSSNIATNHLDLVSTSAYPSGMDCYGCHAYSGTKLAKESIDYTIAVGSGKIQPAVTIVLACASCHDPVLTPHALTASNDAFSLVGGSSANTLAVTANDIGSGVTLDSVGSATNGATALSGGNVLYTPNANYSGPDSFQYAIRDSFGQTVSAIVDLEITTPPQSIAADDPYTVTRDTVGNVLNVLSNDTDAGNGPLTVSTIISQASNGICTAMTSYVAYTPAPGYSGSDNCVYEVSDGTISDTASIIITVAPGHHQMANATTFDPTSDLFAGQPCSNISCHAGEVEDWANIIISHSNYTSNGPSPCDTCHKSNRNTSESGTISVGLTIPDIIVAGGTVYCLDCHLDAGGAGTSH